MRASQIKASRNIPGISEVDTQALTKKLRVDGARKCCLRTLPLSDTDAAHAQAAWNPTRESALPVTGLGGGVVDVEAISGKPLGFEIAKVISVYAQLLNFNDTLE